MMLDFVVNERQRPAIIVERTLTLNIFKMKFIVNSIYTSFIINNHD